MTTTTARARIDYRRPRAGGGVTTSPQPLDYRPGRGMRSNLATVDSSARQIPRERAADDFYCEPAWAVDALLEAERFVEWVYDPACGRGNIPERCKARGLKVLASDLVSRGYGHTPLNFLTHQPLEDAAPTNIICNPPFELAEYFIKRSLELATHKVAMLLRWSFAEGGTGKTEKQKLRRWCLEEAPLSRVYVFANRVSMPPGNVSVSAKGGAVAFGWFVWDHDHRGPATFHRLHRPAGICAS